MNFRNPIELAGDTFGCLTIRRDSKYPSMCQTTFYLPDDGLIDLFV